ncbi:MAG: glycosyltransferase family 9 protein [Rhodospirillales bacterium]
MALPAILVIKLGALGDFVQALGPFAAIRRHHENARVTLLTTEPFRDFAAASGYFDDIWTGGRPGALDVDGWFRLRRRLRQGGFGRVYDLQTSDRSSFYYRLFWPGPTPEWSGIAGGCSHPHASPARDSMHTVERQAEQLAMAGIPDVPTPDLSWATANLQRFALPGRFALLVPGGAAHRPAKRWPAKRFGELARIMADNGVTPVLLGSAEDAPIIAVLRDSCADTIDLTGHTDLLEVAALGRAAAVACGNDTGPMHLISAVGCPSVVLYSDESHPALCGQRGRAITILRRDRLDDLSVDEVVEALPR